MRHGATKKEWNKFHKLGLTNDLLPTVCNPNATLSPRSTLQGVGKIPSKYNAQEYVVGLSKWTEHKSTLAQIKEWAGQEDYGICIITRRLRAFDIDVDDKKIAGKIHDFIQKRWKGRYIYPVRYRENSGKCLLPFYLEGDYGKRVQRVNGGMIETLMNGQQFVAAGMHTSGVWYQWDWKGQNDFPTLDPDDFDTLSYFLEEEFGTEPPTITGQRRRNRKISSDEASGLDFTGQWLVDNNYVHGTGYDKQLFLECPFSDGHSTESNGTDFCYFNAGTNGYERCHFKCLHASCAKRTDRDFEDAFGIFNAEFESLVSNFIEELNEEYMVVNENGKTFVFCKTDDPILKRQIFVKHSFDDFKKLYLNQTAYCEKSQKPKRKADLWLKHPDRREYLKGVVFAPNKDMGEGYLNLWQGWGIKPKKGDWVKLRQHIYEVICDQNKEIFDYVIGWFAHAVQKPDKAGEVALVLKGGRGTGKGTLGHAFGNIFGQHYLYMTNTNHLVGNFNAHLRDAVFIFADECFFAGNKRHENQLKSLITDPLICIEEKYKNPIMSPNYSHIMMASNEDWVIPAGSDERRYCVLDVSEQFKGDHAYFEKLYKEIENGGVAAMFYDLLEYDLSNFNVRAVPKTTALLEQKIRSLRSVDAWLYDILQTGAIDTYEWDDQNQLIISRQKAYDHYAHNHKMYRDYVPELNNLFSKKLKRIMKDKMLKTRPRIERKRVYSFVFASLQDCRGAFEKYIGHKIDWGQNSNDESSWSMRSDVI